MRDKLKEDAKEYIRQLYTSHRSDDIDAWNNLIDIIFLYISESIDEHRRNCDGTDKIT